VYELLYPAALDKEQTAAGASKIYEGARKIDAKNKQAEGRYG